MYTSYGGGGDVAAAVASASPCVRRVKCQEWSWCRWLFLLHFVWIVLFFVRNAELRQGYDYRCRTAEVLHMALLDLEKTHFVVATVPAIFTTLRCGTETIQEEAML